MLTQIPKTIIRAGMDTLLLKMMLEETTQFQHVQGLLMSVCTRNLSILDPDSPSILKLVKSWICDYRGDTVFESNDPILSAFCQIVIHIVTNTSDPQAVIESGIYRSLMKLKSYHAINYTFILIAAHACSHNQPQVIRHLVDVGIMSSFVAMLESDLVADNLQSAFILILREILSDHRDYRRRFGGMPILDSSKYRIVPAGWMYDSEKEDELEEETSECDYEDDDDDPENGEEGETEF
jgi:hypothetical protein